MILYFSGTGNSAYAAKFAADELNDELISINEKIKTGDNSAIISDKPWIVAAPVYCWQLPLVVRDWMLATDLQGNKDIYFIMTCGSGFGGGEQYLKKLCAEKGLNYKGTSVVVMPENYIAMFNVPDEKESEIIMEKAVRTLKRDIQSMKEGKALPRVKTGIIGKLCSGFINDVFYTMQVKDKKFYAKDSCNGCGLCAKKCPLNNIELDDGKPVWKGNCTHCMACISYCPTEAIEYGNKSKGKRRYTLSDPDAK
ncbi:MAG: EFR1 family ferrodoxin [Firmicutes bacterium]|nr:EFR1 family ferrodoxin [Bacillota bacterium]